MLFLAPTSALAFAAVGCPNEPKCDYGTQDYRLVGDHMQCVDRTPSNLTWYNMDHGRCTIISAKESKLEFLFAADAGILFSNAPYKYVLNPREVAELSTTSHFATGKAVAITLQSPDVSIYLGQVAAGVNGVGVLTGRRLIGGDGILAAGDEVDCVIDEVASLDGLSAIAYGECASNGDGTMEIELEMSEIFTGAGQQVLSNLTVPPSAFTDMGVFKGLNAAAYTNDGDFDVFTITKATSTHLSGSTYFSTRLESFASEFGVGKKRVAKCSVFVDFIFLGLFAGIALADAVVTGVGIAVGAAETYGIYKGVEAAVSD